MLLVDANVLVYAVGAQHPLRERALALLQAAAAGRLRLTTTALVVQEFIHVRSRRRGRADAVALAHEFVRLCDPLTVVEPMDVDGALELYLAYERLEAFDALLAATALRSRADGLVSADRAFADVPGLRHYDLATLDEDALTR